MLDVFITSRVRRKIVVVYAKYPDFHTHVRGLAKLIKEHGELLEYCEARDIDRAAQLVRGHVIRASSDLIGFLRESRPESR